MGWGSGSDLMGRIIDKLPGDVPDATVRQRIYTILIEAFEHHDWDTQQDCLGVDPAFDAALHLHWDEEPAP